MINAELIHNPYLLETTVRFNGKEPRINCQIEKYERQPLNTWIEKIPSIFYNEMNGYDFELLFTGTKPDFEALNQVFEAAGVTPTEVPIIHKHELEDAYKKSDEIMRLLGWLADNRNRRFDFEQFRQQNASFFDDPYPMIVINGTDAKIDRIPVSVEIVSTVKELQNTDLVSTPIVFYIDNARESSRRADTEYLLNREDVSEVQLFYFISRKLTPLQRERVIAELGIENPQIIHSFNNDVLKKYIENYPVAEFIRTAIRLFRTITDGINTELTDDNQKSRIINKEAHETINRLDEIIDSLKTAEYYFISRELFCMPSKILAEKDFLEEKIIKWKNKKTKAVGETEIDRMAVVFQYDIQTYFNSFLSSVKEACYIEADEIKNRFENEYRKTENYDGYTPDVILDDIFVPSCPEIKADLMGLVEVTFTGKPKDFFGGIFKKGDSDSIESLKVVTSYFDQWRSKVLDLIIPLASQFLDECAKKLSFFYNELALKYIAHLHILLSENSKKKEKAATRLSGEEKLLQEDNDWYKAFIEKLEHIERG